MGEAEVNEPRDLPIMEELVDAPVPLGIPNRRRDSYNITKSTQLFGFATVYEPREPDLDIIAIHGIGANRDWTWCLHGYNWLSEQEMLPHSFPRARIMTYGYDSNWLGRESISTSLVAVADRFIELTHDIRRGCPKRRMIFIAHCFGGIVVERAILNASTDHNDRNRSLLAHISGIVLLGTPHRGSSSAGLAQVVANIASFCAYGQKSELIETALPDSQMLGDTVRKFAREAFSLNFRIHCFYEEKETDIGVMVKLFGRSIHKKTMLVNRDSACLQGHREIALNLDHFKLNKFKDSKDPNYILVRRSLEEIAETINPPVDNLVLECMSKLYVIDPEFQITELEEKLGEITPEQCLDVVEDVCFQNLRNNHDTGVLWIRGGTEADRITKMIGIKRDLEPLREPLASYFCGSDDNDNLVHLLRTLIWGVIYTWHPLGQHLKNHIQPVKNFKEDIKSSRILFSILLNILQNDTQVPTAYLLVNALDKCGSQQDIDSLQKFIHYTASNQSFNVKWIVSSRSGTSLSSENERWMVEAVLKDPNVTSLFNVDRATEQDGIQLYRVQGLPYSTTEEQARELFRDLVSNKGLNALDPCIWLVPTCDDNHGSPTALILGHLEQPPKESLRLEILETGLIFDRRLHGFTQLYKNPPTKPINADVIAIPGLDMHPYLAWSGEELIGQVWLRDFLEYDLPTCRVLTYGYNSNFSTKGLKAMQNHCAEFLEELQKIRRTTEEVCRPLILIGQGYGAIIAAQALIAAKKYEDSSDPALRELYKAIRVLMFFAMPNRGMLIESIQSLSLGRIVDLTPSLVEAIEDGMRGLMETVLDFNKLVHNRKVINFVPPHHLGGPASPGLWISSGKFTEPNRAILDLSEYLDTTIQASSRPGSLAKFITTEEPTYQHVIRFLRDCERAAEEERGPEWISATMIKPSGFTEVHLAEDAIADIIFIPGLAADPWEVWSTSSRSLSRPAALGKFWPASLLPKEWEKPQIRGRRQVSEWPPARVLVWGFGSNPAIHISTLFEAATQLLEDLMNTRPQGRSIIFVAHSLGGILLKEALRLADEGQTLKAKDIVWSTSAVLFLGTPHRDDGDAQSFFDVVSHAVAEHLAVPVEPVHIPVEIRARLEACQDSFVSQWKAYNFEVKCFAETTARNSFAAGQQARYVVPKIAATLESREIKVETIPATSIGFCRFQTTYERGYSQISMALGGSLRRVKQGEFHLREDCLKSLHFDQLQSRELDIASALDGTGTWLFEHEDYKDWANWDPPELPKQRGLLWIRGKPGSGKSTLMKEALRRAKSLGLRSSFSVAGFFFTHRSNVHLQRSPLGLFMTLLHDLIQQDKELLLAFIAAYKRKTADTLGTWAWHLDELRDFFKSAYLGNFPGIGNAMVFVDALDESGKDANKTPYEVAYDLVHFFRDVTKKNKVKVCLSSRHYPDIKIPDCPQIATEEFNSGDIVHFIAARLFDAKEDARAKKLARKIAVKAAGVFLWVILVVGSLNKSLGNLAIGKDIETILENVPGELEKLFQNLFEKGSSEIAPDAIPETATVIFQWVLLAKRPLEKDELRHALMVDHQKIEALDDTQKWDSSQNCMPGDPEEFLTSLRFYTRGLTEINLRREEKKRWPEFDWIPRIRQMSLHMEIPDNESISQVTPSSNQKEFWMPTEELGYLQIPNNPYQPTIRYTPESRPVAMSKPQRGHPFLDLLNDRDVGYSTYVVVSCSAVQLIHESVREFFLKGEGFAILEGRDQPLSLASRHGILAEYCMACILNHGQGAGGSRSFISYPFLKYAVEALFYHVSQAELNGRVSKRVVRALVEGDQRLWKTWVVLTQYLGSSAGKELLEHNVNVDFAPIHHLCLRQMFLSTSYLLQLGVDVNTQDRAGYSALHYAAERAHVTVVHFLVKNGAQLRIKNQEGKTPLHLVVQCRTSDGILKQLLEPFLAGKPCDGLEDVDLQGWRPLHEAVRAGNWAVVRILLSRGALVNSRTANGVTSLHLAVKSDSLKIVNMLLRGGADPNVLDKEGNGPIHLAAKQQNASLLHSLVNKGANVNTPNRAGKMPIHIRIKENLGIKFLVDAGADINARTLVDKQNILHLLVLASPFPERIVEVINAGINVNATDWSEKTALHYATEKGLFSTVELLLKSAGQDLALSLKDRHGRTPLHYAAQLTEMNIFRLLVDAGADLAAEDKGGKTPVECAGDKIIRNSYLFDFFSLRGYKSTICTINGRNSRVLSLR